GNPPGAAAHSPTPRGSAGVRRPPPASARHPPGILPASAPSASAGHPRPLASALRLAHILILRIQRNEAQPHRPQRHFRPVVHPEFLVAAAHVILRRVPADKQAPGDLLLRISFGDQAQDLQLPRRQFFKPTSGGLTHRQTPEPSKTPTFVPN